MIISNKDAAARLNSPSNLINRIKNSSEHKSHPMDLFGLNRSSTQSNGNGSENGNGKKEDGHSEEEKQKPEENINTSLCKTESSSGRQTYNGNTNNIEEFKERSQEKFQPKIDDLIDDADNKLSLATAHNNALKLMTDSINQLSVKLDNVKADRLPAVITAASKVVEGIRRERSEANKNNREHDVHYHFYTPIQKKVSDYNIVEVEGTVLKDANP